MHIAAASSATFTLPATLSLGSMEDYREHVDIRVTTERTPYATALYSLQSTGTHVFSFMLLTVLSIN